MDKDRRYALLSGLFWIGVWQAVSMFINEPLILPSPVETVLALIPMMLTGAFWSSVAGSFLRIAGGFLLALLAGILLAVCSVSGLVRALLRPLMMTAKSVPVASFVILALFWLGSGKQLAIFISFLMVLPIVYINLSEGVLSLDKSLSEMGEVFGLSRSKRLRYLILPQLYPYLSAACKVGLGLCWKSGVAAEVIGISDNSIGGALYTAKLYYNIGEVLAWTAVLVLLSIWFEKAFLRLLSLLQNRWKRLPAQLSRAKASHSEQSSPPVVLENVSVKLGQTHALDDFSIFVTPGERVAVMGESGCGKTTLLRLLMKRITPDTGRVNVPAKDFGAVFQENRLVPSLNSRDNVRLTNLSLSAETIRQAFLSVGLEEDVLLKYPSELSGGQCRRVALLRALLSNGELLLLDEPFTGLDQEICQRAMEAVLSFRHNRTVICVTHSQKEACFIAEKCVELRTF